MRVQDARDEVGDVGLGATQHLPACHRERDFFIDNLLLQIHLIIEMIFVDRPCALRV